MVGGHRHVVWLPCRSHCRVTDRSGANRDCVPRAAQRTPSAARGMPLFRCKVLLGRYSHRLEERRPLAIIDQRLRSSPPLQLATVLAETHGGLVGVHQIPPARPALTSWHSAAAFRTETAHAPGALLWANGSGPAHAYGDSTCSSFSLRP